MDIQAILGMTDHTLLRVGCKKEEIAQLDAYWQQITQPQTERPADEGPNFAVSAAKRKSRGGR